MAALGFIPRSIHAIPHPRTQVISVRPADADTVISKSGSLCAAWA
jgi:hypothetical protein